MRYSGGGYLEAAVRRIIGISICMILLTGCKDVSGTTQVQAEIASPISSTVEPAATVAPKPSESSTHELDTSTYVFPEQIDSSKKYLFYLHGGIIEDQGIPAISPDYGEYQYVPILETFRGHGFLVISEIRAKNTDSVEYARRITEQVQTLLDAGVPADHISVVGASKGAGITVYISNNLENAEINYVLLAICHPDVVSAFYQEGVRLHGHVLSIYDRVDEWAGSCQELFTASEGLDFSGFEEIVLEIGTGHGILYQPHDAWVLLTIQWAKQNMD
jgi:hypothetical protein